MTTIGGDPAIAAASYLVRIEVDELELRVPSKAEMKSIAELSRPGLHPPEFMPFSVPWTDNLPDARVAAIETWMSTRISVSNAESWTFVVGVRRDGEWVGCSNLFATSLRTTRTVSTGSWVRRNLQGQGIGKKMRLGLLALAFDHLGCELAVSEAFIDNVQSRSVNEAMGYQVVGQRTVPRRDEQAILLRYELTRDLWTRPARDRVRVTHSETLARLLLETRPAR